MGLQQCDALLEEHWAKVREAYEAFKNGGPEGLETLSKDQELWRQTESVADSESHGRYERDSQSSQGTSVQDYHHNGHGQHHPERHPRRHGRSDGPYGCGCHQIKDSKPTKERSGAEGAHAAGCCGQTKQYRTCQKGHAQGQQVVRGAAVATSPVGGHVGHAGQGRPACGTCNGTGVVIYKGHRVPHGAHQAVHQPVQQFAVAGHQQAGARLCHQGQTKVVHVYQAPGPVGQQCHSRRHHH